MQDKTQLEYDVLAASDIRFDANDAQPTYIGVHNTVNAETTSPDWTIYKFTYDGSDTTRIQKTKGVWDDRASLF